MNFMLFHDANTKVLEKPEEDWRSLGLKFYKLRLNYGEVLNSSIPSFLCLAFIALLF